MPYRLERPISVFLVILFFVFPITAASAQNRTSTKIDWITDLESVQRMVETGADVNQEDRDGNHPLNLAVYRKKWDIARYLVEQGADVNAPNASGQTPLMLVLGWDEIELAQFLVERSADVNTVTSWGSSALSVAAMKGNMEIVKYLLEIGADPNDLNGPASKALDGAVERGHFEIVKILVEHGANITPPRVWVPRLTKEMFTRVSRLTGEKPGIVSEKPIDGHEPIWRPLTRAINFSHVEIARYLIEQGAWSPSTDPEMADIMDPDLKLALDRQLFEIADILVAKGARLDAKIGDLPLIDLYLRRNENPQAIQYMRERGVSLDVRKSHGGTNLIGYLQAGDLEKVRTILESGADLNAKVEPPAGAQNKYAGYTPLITAIVFKRPGMPELLIEKGADVNLAGPEGKTPLHFAAEFSSPETIRLLVDKLADIGREDDAGRIPLCIALENDRLDVVDLLLSDALNKDVACLGEILMEAFRGDKKKMDFMIDNRLGLNPEGGMRIPLMFAADQEYLELARRLIERGALVDWKNRLGQTALFPAAWTGNMEMARFLVERGADPAMCDQRGLSPHDYAQAYATEEMAAMLGPGRDCVSPAEEKQARIVDMIRNGIIQRDALGGEITDEQIGELMMWAQFSGLPNLADYKPDKRFSTPEKTWEVYKKALAEHDLATLEKCHLFEGDDRGYIEMYKQLGPEKTREIAEEMRPIERIENDGETAKYRIARDNNGVEISYYIYFIRFIGEWRVSRL